MDKPDDESSNEKAGSYNTIIGTVPDSVLKGSHNTIWNSADSNGSILVNQHETFAFGSAAKAGRGGFAMGAGANAGGFVDAQRSDVLEKLSSLIELQVEGNDKLREVVTTLIQELKSQKPRKNIIAMAWGAISALATADGAANVLSDVEAFISPYIEQG